MNIVKVIKNKKQYIDLLLLADEQENMIDRYLERGDVFVLEDNSVKAICVVTDEGDGICELKNIAVVPEFQHNGYGRNLINHVVSYYSGKFHTMMVGIGDTPQIIRFYKSCGFSYSHRIKNFFTDNYESPIIEDGILLKDMIYLKRNIDLCL